MVLAQPAQLCFACPKPKPHFIFVHEASLHSERRCAGRSPAWRGAALCKLPEGGQKTTRWQRAGQAQHQAKRCPELAQRQAMAVSGSCCSCWEVPRAQLGLWRAQTVARSCGPHLLSKDSQCYLRRFVSKVDGHFNYLHADSWNELLALSWDWRKTKRKYPMVTASCSSCSNKYVLRRTYPSQAYTLTNSRPGCGCLISQMSA